MTAQLLASKYNQTVESAADTGNHCTSMSVTIVYLSNQHVHTSVTYVTLAPWDLYMSPVSPVFHTVVTVSWSQKIN